MLRALVPHQYVRAENSSYSTLCPSVKTVKVREKLMLQQNCFMSRDYQELPASYVREMKANNAIRYKKTVQDLLEFYLSWKDQGSLVNRITTLHSIAKIVKVSPKQRRILQEEREKSVNGEASAYSEILDFISDHIFSCKGQGLANVMWSLGAIREKDHSLVQVCEEEILSRDISAAFHRAEVCCQILPACIFLELKHSAVFERVEEAILAGKIKLHLCENRHIAAILSAFVKAGRGSLELYKVLEANVVQRDFESLHNGDLYQIVQSFALKGVVSEELFSQAEKEILRRTPANFRAMDLVRILRAFAIADKGSEEFFAAFDGEICTKGIKTLPLTHLCWITWAFAARGMTQSKVFKFVAQAIFMRRVKNLKNWQLSLCLYSYVLSEIPFRVFLKELVKEILSRDLESFQGTELCQLTWSCSKAEFLDPELLHRLEEEIPRRNLTQKEASVISESLGNVGKRDKTLPSHLREMCISSSI